MFMRYFLGADFEIFSIFILFFKHMIYHCLYRNLTQLGLLRNDEAGLIRLGMGVAVLALGGAVAFKYFNSQR